MVAFPMLAITASTIALIGLALATIGVVVALLIGARNRPRLRLSVRADSKLTSPIAGLSPTKMYIRIEAVNVGRGLITLNRAWFTKKDKAADRFLIKGSWEPRPDLRDGQTAELFCPQDGLDLDSLDALCVRDGTGKTWTHHITVW